MGFLLQFTELGYVAIAFITKDISKNVTSIICAHTVDFAGLVTNNIF